MGLTAKRVEKLLRKGEPGRHFDGNGLYLAVTGEATGHWLRRYELHGKGHWAGLGGCAAFRLAEARERNRRISQQLADGIDPLLEKRARKAAQLASAATKMSFKEASEKFVAQRDAAWSSRQHAAEYLSTLQRFAWPHLGALDVAAIDVPHVLAVLEQEVPAAKGFPEGVLWTARSVTADRLRNRIESVLSWCAARNYRPKGLNPAAWSDNLEHVLPKPSKVARVNHLAAVPYSELPALMSRLGTRTGIGVKALQFLILTATRSSEVLGATWDEIDNAAVWTIAAARMKGRREHRVPLSPQALALLQDLPRESGNPFLFVGARNEALGAGAMVETLRRVGCNATVHGMRSCFSDFAHERTSASSLVVELSLSHVVGDTSERAYRRTDLFNKRRKLMEVWATFCCSPPETTEGSVVPLRRPA